MTPLAFAARIAAMHQELDIPARYGTQRGLELQPEPAKLTVIGEDVFGRVQRLTPAAAARWKALREAAQDEGVTLLVVSAFRSAEYQQQLIRRKLARGQNIEEILRVNAAPGYSEHHTGRALDLTTPGCEPLTEAFEATQAFAWLRQNGARFGFALSYPRHNRHGFVYEPWHWALREAARDGGVLL